LASCGKLGSETNRPINLNG
jgi:hypothetical protein